jgi:hypothetical protein
MNLLKRFASIVPLPAICLSLMFPVSASAQADPSIAACLKAWGQHPFGNNPQYKTLQTSVKVFGVGTGASDSEATSSPALILVNAGVNVMGGSTTELLNPNGWYCLKSTVNVMGGLNIRAHCRAHLASAKDGTTVMGSSNESKGVTVMGSTNVERVDCK